MNVLKKYKPKNIGDFDFDESYKANLHKFIHNDFMNIVIVGENGTGKTSLINAMISNYLNNGRDKTAESKEQESNYVFRINNLKDCGITFYRKEVRNFCQFPSKRKKMLVVDNLEMVDKSIQAIFKYYMEKWGHNFYFIATTSNPHKINESLLAKTYQLMLPKKTHSVIKKILNNICGAEKMCITNDAKDYIINHCNGKIKVLFMFLQKIYYLNQKITVKLIENNFTMLSHDEFKYYFEICKKKNFQAAFNSINKFLSKGYSICDIFDEMFGFVKIQENTAIFDEKSKYEIIKLISKYILILNTVHEENIELYFFTNKLVNLLNE